jgi:hypothetical protein
MYFFSFYKYFFYALLRILVFLEFELSFNFLNGLLLLRIIFKVVCIKLNKSGKLNLFRKSNKYGYIVMKASIPRQKDSDLFNSNK